MKSVSPTELVIIRASNPAARPKKRGRLHTFGHLATLDGLLDPTLARIFCFVFLVLVVTRHGSANSGNNSR